MKLNDYKNAAFDNAESHGFHETLNFGNLLMLIVSELGEALEADRHEKWLKPDIKQDYEKQSLSDGDFILWAKNHIVGTVEEEIADSLIRIFDLAGTYNIDLDFIVDLKMRYNKLRPYKHGKKY